MPTISELKEQVITDTPLVIFDCALSNGQTEHWCTHAVTAADTQYAARVIQHTAFEIQTASDQGVDGSPKISILLANADSRFSEIERATGWKGARLTVSFLFYDLRNQSAATDAVVVFQGICNPPEEIKEATLRLTATNRMNLHRLLLPQIRIQRRCPWTFPATDEQRQQAVDGGVNGKYSLYYRCGYSAGQSGGIGLMNGSAPFTTCSYNRQDCHARGMFHRFGGLEFVPPAIAVRGYGKDWSTSAVAINQARYNDFVPIVYGTVWYEPLVVFARNDGNLTRMEVLLGIGPMQGVITVLVNNIQIPLGVSGLNMTGTGWYNVCSLGSRDGTFDGNFTDSRGAPAGDPYGSMAYLSVVVPNRISDGNSLPTVTVLAMGLCVPTYGADGTLNGEYFSSNPVWVMLDVLRRVGWSQSELDLPSFANAAAYCDELIPAMDLNGNPVSIQRFRCNLVLSKRRSAGDVIRGIRNTARLFLSYGPGGLLQAHVENTVALQQPTPQSWSNADEPLDGGWPSYEFGDGSNGKSGILRRESGEPSIGLSSRGIADTPNCYTVEFQDELNGYQQDSYAVVDPLDVTLSGQQVTATLMALGLPNYDQAARMLKFNLDRTVRGNTYIVFDTSVKAFGIRPGDLITVTYLKEGLERQPFRVLKIAPATNYRTATITAQFHDDSWYADTNGQGPAGSVIGQGSAGAGVPKPLMGTMVDLNGNIQLGINETDATNTDGSVEVGVEASFVVPTALTANGPSMPMISVTASVTSGGTLRGDQNLYYAISGLDADGNESVLSFVVMAVIVADSSQVTLSGISFAPGTTAFHVYRGTTPSDMKRIASNQPLAQTYADTGAAPQLIAPPDPNFDHANFYWRMEVQPEMSATIHAPTSIGNASLQMPVNGYRGLTARVTRGKGAGQELSIASNTTTVAMLTGTWAVEPDATSYFAIAECGWHFGAMAKSSPVSFTIPNRGGETIQVTGRAANANDVECPAELSEVTRWQIGGAGIGDQDVPPMPSFGLGAGKSGGTMELSGVSFPTLINTKTISSATLTVHYWDELQGSTAFLLAGALAAEDSQLMLNAAGPAQVGTFLQIEAEVLEVTALPEDGAPYSVRRGVHGSEAAPHPAQTPVYHLSDSSYIAPFPEQFFGSPYSGNWSHTIALPAVRIASAALHVTNQKGDSPSGSIHLTHSADNGLRTFAGGQYSFQVDGFLAIDQSAAPAIVVDATHSVRDMFAVLGTSADADVSLDIRVDGATYCQLTFPPGAIVSNSVSGFGLPPLKSGAQITLAVLSVGQTYPGADLTVLVRL
jgi:hypothetical protein